MSLSRLQQSLGYSFKNPALLQKALIHRSIQQESSYERMEYLGDSILNSVVSYWLFLRSDAPEGLLSQRRSLLVCESALYQYAGHIRLSPHIQCAPEIMGSSSIIADSFEAVCAAIFLDSCWKTVYDWVECHFSSLFEEIVKSSSAKDFKTLLQEHTQGLEHILPIYELVSQSGSNHQPLFEISCQFASKIAIGKGASKKQAQQKAAEKMLALLTQSSSKV